MVTRPDRLERTAKIELPTWLTPVSQASDIKYNAEALNLFFFLTLINIYTSRSFEIQKFNPLSTLLNYLFHSSYYNEQDFLNVISGEPK